MCCVMCKINAAKYCNYNVDNWRDILSPKKHCILRLNKRCNLIWKKMKSCVITSMILGKELAKTTVSGSNMKINVEANYSIWTVQMQEPDSY